MPLRFQRQPCRRFAQYDFAFNGVKNMVAQRFFICLIRFADGVIPFQTAFQSGANC